ncbi:hypothetical protein G3N92_19250 [Burkholderia sp. Ac-20379]|nr:hypothetical protein [Burkholderia sp. Ac-20379]
MNRSQLLPLPADYLRRVRLRHHIALASLRGAQAAPEQLALLLSTVQIAYLLRSPAAAALAALQAAEAAEAVAMGEGGGACDPRDIGDEAAPYRRAERAIEQCYVRLSDGAADLLHDDERRELERLMTAFDARLATLPTQRYLDAQAELHHYVFTGRSPIPAAHA